MLARARKQRALAYYGAFVCFDGSQCMLGRLQNLRRHFTHLTQLRYLSLERLSPIERYCALSASQQFTADYELWRVHRIRKVLELLGANWEWSGKRFLELGSGFGDIGAFFADAGADVLSVEGRVENLSVAKLRFRGFPNLKFVQRDVERDISDLGRFDAIVHFGLLYHLEHVDANLRSCAAMANRIFLETEVLDSLDDRRVVKLAEGTAAPDSGLSGSVSMISPFFIKRVLEECGMRVDVISDASLNCKPHVYDWKHRNDGSWVKHRRRFFYARREPA